MLLPTPAHLLLSALLAVAIAGAAKALRSLSWSGMLAAALVGFLLFGFGGGQGAAALLLFFVTSSALSKVGKKRKAALHFEKGGERDAAQVLANGGVAALCAAFLPVFPHALWLIFALLGSLAAANADTWATEIGSLAKGRPRRITDFKPAATGESGAVSLPGTLAALAGAFLIALVALFWGGRWLEVVAVTVGGLFGSLFDSLLGATVQEQFRDSQTGKLTERRHADDGTTFAKVRGIAGVNNDVVNTLATLSGAIIAALLAG